MFVYSHCCIILHICINVSSDFEILEYFFCRLQILAQKPPNVRPHVRPDVRLDVRPRDGASLAAISLH